MKILIAYAKFDPNGRAGSDVYLRGMCRELAKLGHDVTVATTASRGFVPVAAFSLKWQQDESLDSDQGLGFRILRFPISSQIPDSLRKPVARFIVRQWDREDFRDGALQSHSPRFPEFTLQQVKTRNRIFDRLHAYTIGPSSSQLRRYLHQHSRDYDCVIAGYFPFNIVKTASIAARKAGRPFFVAPLWHSEDRHHYFRHLFEALRDSDGIICETQNAQNLFEVLVPGSCCVKAGIGVDSRHLSPPAGAMPAWIKALKEKGQRLLLYVGRKEESKNYALLVQVMRRLNDPSVTLLMIGKDVDQKPIWHPRVELHEQVDDNELQWAYWACDIFLFPSQHESFGIVVLEAWAAQKAVIANSRCAAVSSLIEPGRDGLLCKTEEEWFTAIKTLLDDPDRRQSLGTFGHQTLLSNYTWAIVGKKVSDFLQAHSRKPSPV